MLSALRNILPRRAKIIEREKPRDFLWIPASAGMSG